MQNQDRIVELLAEMLYKQDIFIDELRGVKQELVTVNRRLDEQSEILKEHGRTLKEHSEILREHTEILTRHERLHQRHDQRLERILDLVSENVIRFEEILYVEQLEGGKRIVLHKSKHASNL